MIFNEWFLTWPQSSLVCMAAGNSVDNVVSSMLVSEVEGLKATAWPGRLDWRQLDDGRLFA